MRFLNKSIFLIILSIVVVLMATNLSFAAEVDEKMLSEPLLKRILKFKKLL